MLPTAYIRVVRIPDLRGDMTNVLKTIMQSSYLVSTQQSQGECD